MSIRYLTTLCLLLFALGGPQAGIAQAAPTPTKLDSGDRDFLESAAQAGHLEVQASRLALEKTRNADLKAFAQEMIDEHGKAGQQLAALAHGKGYDVPTEPSLTQKARLKALGLRDEGFDKAYAEEIGVGAHEDAVALFEKASNDVKDPDIRQFAIQTLPTLRQHLRMAATLKQGMDKP
ncbi:DUF4142 domain-containing protein [Achromobacter ruhlandii]|uniref:DUF4142 domain-containing protein n=1 Tax=Achromobacter ruhlandii TaxID=72557 RepID=UPI0007BEF14B|nr:DUF4142 domain-containing protein [Achromobacter ruhlandii]